MITVPSALHVLGHKKLKDEVAKELNLEEPMEPEKVIAAAIAAKGNKDEDENKEVEADEAA